MESTETHESEALHAHEAPAAKPATPGHVRLASGMGNRTFGRAIARLRAGEGIGPNGRVDRHVLAAIDASRQMGRPLQREVAREVESHFGAPPPNVRLHEGAYARELARAVDARAFTIADGRGSVDIFYGHGERPGADRHLDYHELAHAYQQKNAPYTSDVAVSMPRDSLENAADQAAARALTGGIDT